MIIVGGEGGLLVLLLFLGLFLLVPVLFLRAARRAVLLAVERPVGHPTGGWTGRAPARSGWALPAEPVLPPVSPADVASLRDRLGHDVTTLEPGADPVARQAMADASERLSTCSTLLERADSQAQLRTAWLAAVEGLTATRLVRTRLGLDAGPPVPLPPSGPGLQTPTQVAVGGRTHVGGPEYEPGRPHWFPGGAYDGHYVPGGWYRTPFWPSGLVLGGLGGLALGGLVAGSMFDDDLLDSADDSGGYGGADPGQYDDGFGGFGGGGGWGDAEDGGWGDSDSDSDSGWGDSGGGGDAGGGGD